MGDLTEPKPLTKRAAAALTEQTRQAGEEFYALLARCHDEKAWAVMGYASWREYVASEFGSGKSTAYRLLDQARVVAELEEAGVPRARDSVSQRSAAVLAKDAGQAAEEVARDVGDGMAPAKAVKKAAAKRRVIDTTAEEVTERGVQPTLAGTKAATLPASGVAQKAAHRSHKPKDGSSSLPSASTGSPVSEQPEAQGPKDDDSDQTPGESEGTPPPAAATLDKALAEVAVTAVEDLKALGFARVRDAVDRLAQADGRKLVTLEGWEAVQGELRQAREARIAEAFEDPWDAFGARFAEAKKALEAVPVERWGRRWPEVRRLVTGQIAEIVKAKIEAAQKAAK